MMNNQGNLRGFHISSPPPFTSSKYCYLSIYLYLQYLPCRRSNLWKPFEILMDNQEVIL